jgi:hypothetical protein
VIAVGTTTICLSRSDETFSRDEEAHMSEAGATEGPDPMKAVADAMEAAVEAAKEGASDAVEAAGRALPVAGGVLSKLAYNTCYTISYGVVFPSVLLARSVPQNNAMVNGLVDGAKAAMDMVGEMRSKNGPSAAGTGTATGQGGEHPDAPAVS